MIASTTVAVEVGDVAPAGVERVVTEVFFDAASSHVPTSVIVCLPGGGTTRRYFDLRPADGDASYSVAQSLVDDGHIVVTVDPPALGESDRPDDAYLLTPHVVADVCAAATREVLDRVRRGTIAADLPALPGLSSIGLGFSAGAVLTTIVQARHHLYDALVLVGFHGRGLPQFLPDSLLPFVDEPARLRDEVVELTKGFFGQPLPVLQPENPRLLLGGSAPEKFIEAMREAQGPLLGLVGLTALLPGSVREELEVVDVPVFIGVGDHDIANRAREMPVELPASRDVTVFELAGAGHEQLVAPNRSVLLHRISSWVESIGNRAAEDVVS
jgi:pimeloyl-ACP methyl ester carboxylesterase